MNRGFWFFAAAAIVMVSASAVAQGPHPAPGGILQGVQNQDQPVQIDAKSLEVRDRQKTATFFGDVRVVQGDTTMRCKTLVVFYGEDPGSGGGAAKPVVRAKTASGTPPNAQNIRRIEARGDVTVTSKDQNASGDLGVYDLHDKTITLSGNVVVSQGKNVIHGERVIVDTVTGNARVEAAPGAAQGRVRALIIPNNDSKSGESNFMTIGPGPGPGPKR